MSASRISSRVGKAPSVEPVIPADPLAEAAAHDVLEVPAPKPWQFLGEEGHALAVAALHPRDVGPPEEALGSERIEDAVQPVLDVAERIALRRIMRRAGRFHGDIGQSRQRHELVEMDESLRIAAATVGPAVID